MGGQNARHIRATMGHRWMVASERVNAAFRPACFSDKYPTVGLTTLSLSHLKRMMLLLLRVLSGHNWPLVYCSFMTPESHVGPDATWPRLTYSSPAFIQDAALEGHFHEPAVEGEHRLSWDFSLKHASVRRTQTCRLTIHLHQRPADVDVKCFLRVVCRRLHLPVPRVHSQRREVVRLTLTITEERRDIRRSEEQFHVCSEFLSGVHGKEKSLRKQRVRRR